MRPNIKHPLPGEEIHGSVCNTSCPALFVHLLFKNQRIRTSNRWIQTYCQRFVDKLIHVGVACCGHNSAQHERVQMVAHVESVCFNVCMFCRKLLQFFKQLFEIKNICLCFWRNILKFVQTFETIPEQIKQCNKQLLKLLNNCGNNCGNN